MMEKLRILDNAVTMSCHVPKPKAYRLKKIKTKQTLRKNERQNTDANLRYCNAFLPRRLIFQSVIKTRFVGLGKPMTHGWLDRFGRIVWLRGRWWRVGGLCIGERRCGGWCGGKCAGRL